MYKRILLMNVVMVSALIAFLLPQVHGEEKKTDSFDSEVIAR